MDTKIIAIFAAAIVIAASGTAAFVLLGDKDDDLKQKDVTGRLVIYGNANNDDYLDNDDVSFLQNLIDGATWNKEKYPFADTNADGKISDEDMILLKKFLAGENTEMKYMDYVGTINSIQFPLSGKISASYLYGLDAAIILGCYEDVIGADHYTIVEASSPELKYPGFDKLINLGNITFGDASLETLLTTDTKIMFGYGGDEITILQQRLKDAGSSIQIVNLAMSEYAGHGCDSLGSIITLGVMMQKEKAAYKYLDFCDTILDKINKKASSLDKIEFMMPYIEYSMPSETTTDILTIGTDGNIFAPTYTVYRLPLKDIAKPGASGRYVTSIESILAANPEHLIICQWGNSNLNETYQQGYNNFKAFADCYKTSDAYKSGQVYGISYETFGTFPGIAALALLASYIWPDDFDSDYGWMMLQKYYDNFTKMDIDVKKVEGIAPYKL